MAVKIIDDKYTWDKFIDSSPYGLLFHKWDFLKIMEKHTGYKLLTYGVYRGDEPMCFFPLFYKKSKGVKMAYSPPRQSLTYVPYLGPVMSPIYKTLRQKRKESYIIDVIDEMDAEIAKFSPDYSYFALVPGMTDVRPFMWKGYDVNVHFTYFIDLTKSEEELYANFDGTCRKNIISCKDLGLSIKQVNDVETFYDIMKDRLKGEDVIYFQREDREYLADILNAYPDNIKMYFTYMGDKVAAVKITINYNGKCILWMGGGVIQKDAHINEYTIWEFIKMAKRDGCTVFENWGADLKRLNRFKSKFSPTLDVCFTASKKSLAGNVAQWTYGRIANIGALKRIRNKIY